MPVFLSYHRPDELKARSIYNRLQQVHSIVTYMDVLDEALTNAPSVTGQILQRLSSCTHLLAFISDTTVQSWWVPFEIGAATQNERRIASYNASRKSRLELPDYLRLWPVLRDSDDLDKVSAQ